MTCCNAFLQEMRKASTKAVDEARLLDKLVALIISYDNSIRADKKDKQTPK